LNQYQPTIGYYKQALTSSLAKNSSGIQAEILYKLVTVNECHGHYEQAIEYLQQLLDYHQKCADYIGESNCLEDIGILYYRLMQYERALEYFQESLEITRKFGLHHAQCYCLVQMGNAYYRLTQYERAFEYFQESLEIASEIGVFKQEWEAIIDPVILDPNAQSSYNNLHSNYLATRPVGRSR